MFNLALRRRLPATLLITALLLTSALIPSNAVDAAPAAAGSGPTIGRVFPDTGHMLDPVFTGYYDRNSGSRVLGSPLTESYQDGDRIVQVFQRGRLEYDAAKNQAKATSLGLLLIAGRAPDPALPPPAEDPAGLYDSTTGHSVGAAFAAYWLAAGGSARLGRPISEVSAQGNGSVQYFQFGRLQQDAAGKITARLQDNVSSPASPFEPVAKPASTKGLLYVSPPGHIVLGGFYDIYRSVGGAETLGVPLTEEAWEGGATVQYFERGKLEWHQDYPPGKQVVLADLGSEWLLTHPAPAGALAKPAPYQIIGTATTSFRDSIPGRVHNLTLATQRLNGVVVPAGGVFSFNKSLGPDGAAAGFVIAKIIYNGRTIDGIGGGICQVATTMFRAAFFAGMDFVERHPHTYRVSFYEPPVGFDATVFSDEGVDLKWRNNLDVPVLIQTAVDARAQTITFSVLATKPAKYKATFSGPVISNVVKHGPPIYEDDPTLAVGKVKQTEHAKDGLDTKVTRTLTDPATGKVVRTETFFSRYVAWNDRYSRGTKGAKPKAPAATPTPAGGPAILPSTPAAPIIPIPTATPSAPR